MMRYLTTSLLYILIVCAFLQNWVIVFAVALTLFSVRHSTLVLVPTALLIDGYFGNYHTFPVLTVLALGWYVVTEFLRPKIISVYTNEYDESITR